MPLASVIAIPSLAYWKTVRQKSLGISVAIGLEAQG